MSNTKEKLEEAKFFLEQFEKQYRNVPQARYYLSAYISAARSVLWVMRHEYQDVLGWEEWFVSKKPNDKTKQFLKSINELRVQAVKLGTMNVRYMLEMLVLPENLTRELEEFFEKSRGKKLKLKVEVVDPNDESTEETIVGNDYAISRFKYERSYIMLDEFPEEDILDICKEYYSIIEQLVLECEERFRIRV